MACNWHQTIFNCPLRVISFSLKNASRIRPNLLHKPFKLSQFSSFKFYSIMSWYITRTVSIVKFKNARNHELKMPHRTYLVCSVSKSSQYRSQDWRIFTQTHNDRHNSDDYVVREWITSRSAKLKMLGVSYNVRHGYWIYLNAKYNNSYYSYLH